MWIKTDKGRCQCSIESLAALEPDVLKVREAYRKACAERPQDKDAHGSAVLKWSMKNFGPYIFNRDFEAVCGRGVETPTGISYGGCAGVAKWDAFIESKPLEYRKWYLDPTVVAGCIMGDDE